MQKIAMIGRRFGRLLVLSQAETLTRPNGDKPLRWGVRCDCGSEFIALGDKLRSGHTKSCGCLKLEILHQKRVHGEAHKGAVTREYICYLAMKGRCENPRRPDFKHYGGRGIKVCERWRQSYKNFLADMDRRPSPKHSIDRINNDGDYEPSNCRWATQSEQVRNQRPRSKSII